MKQRFIRLDQTEISRLKEIKKHSSSERERDRSHALLLSNRGQTIGELSAIFEVRRATITEWLDRWEKEGLEGLSDAPKSGHPTIYSVAEEKK